jgi:hypothetical protein
MKDKLRIATAVAGFAALAACVSRPAPPAPPQPAPAPAPAPVPPPPATQLAWEDAPITPGDWAYHHDEREPLASFGTAQPLFGLRCQSGRSILLILNGVHASFVVRTSYGERRLSSDVHFGETIAELPAADPFFDQLAFSRGRFSVQGDGPGFVIPTWPEPARVIEDCRGQ